MIRLLLVGIFLVVFLILSLPVQLVLYIVGRCGHQEAVDYFALRNVQLAFKVIQFMCGIRLTVIGEENVPKDKPVMYVGNHNSFFDIVVTYARTPRLTGYISKDSLNKVPGLRVWMKLLHCLFLDRTDLKAGMKMLLDAINLINSGISVCIFPEGTRNTTGDERNMNPFKEGSFKIADKTDCLIVPMALTGTAAIFEEHLPWIKGGRVTLQYGEPIDPATLEKDQRKKMGALSQQRILEMIENQKSIA